MLFMVFKDIHNCRIQTLTYRKHTHALELLITQFRVFFFTKKVHTQTRLHGNETFHNNNLFTGAYERLFSFSLCTVTNRFSRTFHFCSGLAKFMAWWKPVLAYKKSLKPTQSHDNLPKMKPLAGDYFKPVTSSPHVLFSPSIFIHDLCFPVDDFLSHALKVLLTFLLSVTFFFDICIYVYLSDVFNLCLTLREKGSNV